MGAAAEFAAPECAPLLTAARMGGGRPPSVGYELAGAAARLIGQAELAWEARHVAVFLDDADASRDVFAGAGWRTYLATEVEAIVAALTRAA